MRIHDTMMKSIFVFILFGYIVTTVLGFDYVFPFSNYPMYSNVFEPNPVLIRQSVVVETQDGMRKGLFESEEVRPFWDSSFREALFADKDQKSIENKFQSALRWVNERRVAKGLPPYKRMLLYRHDIPWEEFVRLRLKNENIESLYAEYAILRLEVLGEK